MNPLHPPSDAHPLRSMPSPKEAEHLTVREWWHHVGTDNVLLVVAELKTSLPYLRAIAYRYKVPSYKYAKALVAAAQRLTPGFVPDLERVLEPLPPKGGPRSRTFRNEPSAQYLQHQRYLGRCA